MTLTDILIIASFAFILVFLWVVIGATELKHSWKKMKNQWELLDEALRKRQSVVPLLIETFRQFEKNETLVKNLMAARLKAAKEYSPGAKKIEYENDLTVGINALVDVGMKNSDLSKNTAFLSVKSRIEGLEAVMETESKKYNDAVRANNKKVRSFFFFLIAKIFGYKSANIFDVES